MVRREQVTSENLIHVRDGIPIEDEKQSNNRKAL